MSGIPMVLGFGPITHALNSSICAMALVLSPLGESLGRVGWDLVKDLSVEAKRSLVLGWGLEILKTLTEMHRRGVLHRDIKPGNVILSDGQVVLIDFGISIAADALAKPREPG